MKPEEALGRLMVAATRRRYQVLALAALLTLASGLIVLLIEPDVETDVQAGTFPIGDRQADAFRALRADVAGINSELVYLELKADARAPDGSSVADVREREASLAVQELFDYVERRYVEIAGEQKVVDYTGYAYLLKLVNSYFPDGDFAIPSAEQYARSREILQATDEGSLAFYFSDDYRATIISILYDPAGDKAATAGLINEIIAEYRALPTEAGTGKTWDLWQEQYLDSWGIQSWIYRVDEQVSKDLTLLVPLVVLGITLLLLAALRDLRAALLGISVVGAVQLWTLAAMTLLGLPIGFISMALFPLLLGVGVDYVLHVSHEYSAARHRNQGEEEALRHTGRGAGIALVVSTLTTVTGFFVIMLSRSPMIVQIAVATILGMSLMLAASLLVLPALLPWFEGRNFRLRNMSAGTTAVRMTRLISRARIPVVLLLLLASALLIPHVQQTEFAVATVQNNLPSRPQRSHMLVMYDRFEDNMGASGQESFIHQGDMTDPAVMLGLIRTHEEMEAEPFFGAALSLPFVIDLHQALQGSPIGPLATVPEALRKQFPELPAELTSTNSVLAPPPRFERVRNLDAAQLDEVLTSMWNDERWSPLARSFLDKDFTITWTFSFIDVVSNAEATERADAAMKAILERVGPQPADTTYFGTLTALKRINDQAAHWLTISAIADLVVLAGLVAIVTRNLRSVLAVTMTLGLGLVWWLAILSLPGVELQLSFVYLIPLAFVTSMGSDYAVHLTVAAGRAKTEEERTQSYRSVGRAILYSFSTTAIAFFIFTWSGIRGSAEMFQASTLAIFVAAFLTLAIIPLFYPVSGPAANNRALPEGEAS